MPYEQAHEVDDPENPHYDEYYADLDVLSLQLTGCLCWFGKYLLLVNKL